MHQFYGRPLAFLGQGGSIPLCNHMAHVEALFLREFAKLLRH